MATCKAGGTHYALTAIGIGLVVLGVIMAVWNLVPGFVSNDKPSPHKGNSSTPAHNDGGTVKSKTFSVAYVLVGAGIVLLLLAICLTVREKKKRRNEGDSRDIQEVSALPREQDNDPEEEDVPRYGIPSYDEVMGPEFSSTERIDFDRNARISMSLPSYESLNELDENTPTTISPKESQIERQSSDKKRKPLNVRRIKSDKLHLKDFRLKFANSNTVPLKIEPLTPPPQYDGQAGGESSLPA